MGWLPRGIIVALVVFSTGRAAGQSVGLGEGNRFEIELRRWRPTLASDLQMGGEEPIRLPEDLGLSDETDNEYRGFLRFGRWLKMRGSYVRLQYGGTKTVEKDIDFAGVVFPEGTEVTTSMEFENLRVGAEVDILLLKEGLLAVVADWTTTDVKPVLTSAGAEADGGKLRVQLLTLGLKGRIYLTPALALTAEASGMKRSSTGVITDVEGVVTYSLSRNIAVSFGYRNHYTKWLNEGDRSTFRIKGYFFSGSLRF